MFNFFFFFLNVNKLFNTKTVVRTVLLTCVISSDTAAVWQTLLSDLKMHSELDLQVKVLAGCL